jgi:N-acetylmuramoyl-L-alanine amidase
MRTRLTTAVVLAVLIVTAVPAWTADQARVLYTRALDQERTVRDESNEATIADMRRLVSAYEQIVRRYPTSGYSDNALWQAANISLLAAQRFGQDADRKTAARLLTALTTRYPSSRFVPQAREALHELEAGESSAVVAESHQPTAAPQPPPARTSDPKAAGTSGGPVALSDIHRALLSDGVRVIMDLDAEVTYHQEEVDRPRRVFFDLKGVRASTALQDATLKFDDDVVREIRLGRHPQNTVRVVLDLDGVEAYSVYSLYNPYRLVVDLRRAGNTKVVTNPPPLVASLPAPTSMPAKTEVIPTPPAIVPTVAPNHTGDPEGDDPGPALPSRRPALKSIVPPASPSANSDGKFSMSRQLGLSVSRIVIDAGHGGHDPGAQGNGVSEAELTLDLALRLRKLLEKQPGVEVVTTRDTDVFVPLQERTAIANRENADLFLSIHANASRNPEVRGIETYFLNFATNREAEAVAARENAGSGQTMHNLPDIVKAIALNNKINESRDLAETVQKSMVRRLGTRSKPTHDLGVKQAPFVVLIGASMPSVLAEISFVTNRQDGVQLKTGAYRQQIAQALFDAILTYQQGLKKMNAIAGKKATF